MRISDWSSDVCSSDLDAGTHEQLQKIFLENANPNWRLRAMWTLHVTGGFNINQLISALDDQDEYIRAWAVQLICEDKQVPVKAMARFYERLEDGRRGKDDVNKVRLRGAPAH